MIREQKIINIGGYTLEIQLYYSGYIRLVFRDYNEAFNKIKLEFIGYNEIYNLIGFFEAFVQQKVDKYDYPFGGGIITKKEDGQRAILLSGETGHLIMTVNCTSDEPYADNFIDITPRRLSELIGYLYGYLGEEEEYY